MGIEIGKPHGDALSSVGYLCESYMIFESLKDTFTK